MIFINLGDGNGVEIRPEDSGAGTGFFYFGDKLDGPGGGQGGGLGSAGVGVFMPGFIVFCGDDDRP